MPNRLQLLLCLCALLSGPLLAEEKKLDIAAPQSPPKPIPEGMKFIDQGQFNPALKGYTTPEGFRLEIVGTEPTIINPVGMTFGPDGTLYVLEWVPDTGGWPETPETFTYKDGTKRNVATMKKKVKDVLKILTLNPEKKIYEKSEIILEDELPSSVLVHDGWIYLSGRGTVRRFKQSQPGGKYDVKEVIAQGFCGFHHHQVSGMTIGNDGWLYITSGDDDNFVEGSDGSRATVLRTGAVFRCKPDGSKMHMYSMGWRNPYRDLAFDTSYNWFHVDNDNEDGSKFTGCRLMHVAEESDFGWRLFGGARCCKPDMIRGAVYGELPGKMPPMLKTGRGSPAGLLIYNDTKLPEFYRGWLMYPDCFRKLIRAYRVEQANSTFRVENEFELVKSEDPLFRPCQMVTGPDGAIYICDWRTDSGGAGKLWGDGVHGRILRLTWGGGNLPGEKEVTAAIPLRNMDSWAKILKQSDEELLKTLAAEDFSDRLIATGELRRRGDKNRPALLKLLADDATLIAARLAAVGVLQSFFNDDVRSTFIAVLKDKNEDLRRLAVDALGLNCASGDSTVQPALMTILADPDRSVRRAAVLAIGKINNPGTGESLANLFKFDDGLDVYFSDAILRGIERVGKPGFTALIGMANSGNDKDRDKVVAGFLTFRTRAAAESLPDLLAIEHLTPSQRVELIRSYTNYLLDPPLAMDPLLEFLAKRTKDPMEVQTATVEVLAETGNLKGPKAVNLLTTLLDSETAETRMVAIGAIEKARLTDASSRLVQVLADAKRVPAERIALIKALRVLGDKSAAPVLKEILTGKTPATLRTEALRSLAVLDAAAARPIAEKLLDQGDISLQSEAVQVLGSSPEGAKIVGERFLAKKLPRDLLPQVSDALRNHATKTPALSVMLTEVMKGGLLLSLNPGEIEKVRTLVTTKGNAEKGREIYLNSRSLQCVNCHKLEGIGGQVGPDLTRIWDTSTIEKIMESIIEPSKEIKEGYQSMKVTTLSGQVFTGLKVVDKANEVVLRDANGKDQRFDRKDIESIEASKLSLMPDNVVSQLTFDQFIDLVAFLKNRPAQESLRGMVTDFWIAGPFGNDHQAVQPPEKNPDPKAEYPGEKPEMPIRWQQKTTEPNGYLNFRSVYNSDRISAYALTYVYSPKKQKVALMVGADDLLAIWIDGKKVADRAIPRPVMKPDDERYDVELNEGWNTVLVKVVNRLGEHGLFLRFSGGEVIKSATKKE